MMCVLSVLSVIAAVCNSPAMGCPQRGHFVTAPTTIICLCCSLNLPQAALTPVTTTTHAALCMLLAGTSSMCKDGKRGAQGLNHSHHKQKTHLHSCPLCLWDLAAAYTL
jgi:hypothetical protein